VYPDKPVQVRVRLHPYVSHPSNLPACGQRHEVQPQGQVPAAAGRQPGCRGCHSPETGTSRSCRCLRLGWQGSVAAVAKLVLWLTRAACDARCPAMPPCRWAALLIDDTPWQVPLPPTPPPTPAAELVAGINSLSSR